MPEITARLTAALADRYIIERELGDGSLFAMLRHRVL